MLNYVRRQKITRIIMVGARPKFLATLGSPRIPTPKILFIIVTIVRNIEDFF